MNKALFFSCILVLLLALVVPRSLNRAANIPPVASVAPVNRLKEPAVAAASTNRRALQSSIPKPRNLPVDARQLLAAVEAETDDDSRSAALESGVESISDTDIRDVFDSLLVDTSAAAGELRQLLVRRWADSDAPTAANWAAHLPEGAATSSAMEQVALAWANTDIAAAGGWLQTLPEGDGRQAATLALAGEASRSDPAAALQLAAALPPSQSRDDLFVQAASQWAGADPAAASAWAQAVTDPALRARLIGAVAVASVAQDAAAAATLAVTSLAAGTEQDRALVSIVQRWGGDRSRFRCGMGFSVSGNTRARRGDAKPDFTLDHPGQRGRRHLAPSTARRCLAQRRLRHLLRRSG